MKIKVITLNLWNGGRLMDRVIDFLQAEQPDILFLQEAYAGRNPSWAPRFRSVPILTDVFPNYDYNFAPAYCDTRQQEGDIEDGQLILSKFSITFHNMFFFDVPYAKLNQDETTDFSNWPAGVQHCRIQIGDPSNQVSQINNHALDQEIDLLNVHGPVNFNGSQDSIRRLKMSHDLVNLVQNQSHAILAGDFNVRPNTQTIRNLEQHLTNVFANELTTTFNMKQKTNPGYADSVVDMMLVSPTIKIIDHHQPQVDISDHLPLVAILEL